LLRARPRPIDRRPRSTSSWAYFLDTDTISAVLRPRRNLAVSRRLATVPATAQSTSAITPAKSDLRIAAIAPAFDLVLVTGNEGHLRRVPNLNVENWLASG
jgi:predicted nucleic acid-binding protein